MKRILFMMLVITAALSSCNKDKTTDPAADQSSGSNLPLKAVTYVSENYPDATIDYYFKITNGAADYLVTLTTTEELAFNKTGDFLGMGENFKDGQHGDSIPCDSIHGGGHHGGGIPIDSLPVILKDYVTANYAGYVIRRASFDSLCFNGEVIGVMLFQPGSVPVKLYFATTGEFLMQANRIRYADIPQTVKDYITANYATFHATPIAEKLTLADNSIQYIVFVHKGPTRKSVRIDAAGAFICEQTGFHHGGHGGPGPGCPPGGGIPIDSLPASIQAYLSGNYAGYLIRHARYDSLCVNGLVFEVRIDKPHVPPIDLYFDMTGSFLMKADLIRYFDLPLTVREFLIATYPGFFVCEIPKMMTLADGSVQYKVNLSKHHAKKTVWLDANAVIICEQ
jgi:hypothetical protein